jgi:hypothetical protein
MRTTEFTVPVRTATFQPKTAHRTAAATKSKIFLDKPGKIVYSAATCRRGQMYSSEEARKEGE